MIEFGYTPKTLAAKIINHTTGKALTARAVHQWLGTYSSFECASADSVEQLQALLPGLCPPSCVYADEQNRGPSKAPRRHRQRTKTTLNSTPSRCEVPTCKQIHSWNGARWICHLYANECAEAAQ